MDSNTIYSVDLAAGRDIHLENVTQNHCTVEYKYAKENCFHRL